MGGGRRKPKKTAGTNRFIPAVDWTLLLSSATCPEEIFKILRTTARSIFNEFLL
jgi:hypothetical protein